jgi:hypothetical protein
VANNQHKEWVEDCKKWRDKPLNGPFAHWCFEWDGLPVDMWQREFTCCLCFKGWLFEVAQRVMELYWRFKEQ